MAISIKMVRGHRYAYEVFRSGGRVVQSYLGRFDDPNVKAFIKKNRSYRRNIPEYVRALFWETDKRKISIEQHADAIIYKVFEYGDLRAVLWVQRRFGIDCMQRVLRTVKGISEKSRIFFQLWLKDFE